MTRNDHIVRSQADLSSVPDGSRVILDDMSVDQLIFQGRNDLRVVGDGAAITGTDDTKSVLSFLDCTDIVVEEGVTVVGPAGSRNASNHGIKLDGCDGFDVHADVGAVLASGVFVTGSTDGELRGRVNGTLADGFHITGQSARIGVVRPEAVGTGDDAVAVVSYQSDGGYCTDIDVLFPTIRQSKSRGVAFIGGKRLNLRGGLIDTVKNAAVYVAYDGSFSTYGVTGALIDGPTVVDANTYDTPVTNYAAIDVRSGNASFPVEHVTVRGAQVWGGGWRMIGVGSGLSAVKHVDLLGNRLVGPHGTRAAAHAINVVQTESIRIARNRIHGAYLSSVYVENDCTGTVEVSDNHSFDHDTSGGGASAYNVKPIGAVTRDNQTA